MPMRENLFARLTLLNAELWSPSMLCLGGCVSERKLKPRPNKRLPQTHRHQKDRARVQRLTLGSQSEGLCFRVDFSGDDGSS